MPHSVAKLVGKKNNYRWFYRRKLRTKKKFPLEIYQRIYSVGECELPTEYFHRSRRRWLWNLHQASVKCRRINAVCKFVAKMINISHSLSNADGYSSSVKPSVIIFRYVFKKLFRINNIKLYKLIVKKTNYANKIFIKHKKKLNNIHYKLNVF